MDLPGFAVVSTSGPLRSWGRDDDEGRAWSKEPGQVFLCRLKRRGSFFDPGGLLPQLIGSVFHFLHQTAKGLALCPGFHQEGCVDLFCEMTRLELKHSIAKFVADVGDSDEVDWATHGSCKLVSEDDGFFVERKFPEGVKVPTEFWCRSIKLMVSFGYYCALV